MKTFQTLSNDKTLMLVRVADDFSDCIEMCSSEGYDLIKLVAALKSEAKHGCLGEALAWLFVDESRESSDECFLMMKEDRENPDWVKSYSAVYWFLCGWADHEFASK